MDKKKSGTTFENNTPVGSAGQPNNTGANFRKEAIKRRMKKNSDTGKSN